MKSAEEMFERLMSRREEYLKEKAKKQRLALRTLVPVMCVCILAAGFFALDPHFLDGDLTSDTDSFDKESTAAVETKYSETYDPNLGYFETYIPDYSYNISRSNMVIVKWGEPVYELRSDSVKDCQKTLAGIAVNYIKSFEGTLYGFEPNAPNEKFDCLQNGSELKEKYDDIILVCEDDMSSLKTGDTALVSIHHDTHMIGNSSYHYVSFGKYIKQIDGHHFEIYPIENGKLVVPSNMYDKLNSEFASPGLYDLYLMNNVIRRADKNAPIFISGISMYDLIRYFELATDDRLYS